MAINFNHKDMILAIKEGFLKYFKAHTSRKVEWRKDFGVNDFRDAYISGKGKNEKLILSTEIVIGSKSLPVKFIEDKGGCISY